MRREGVRVPRAVSRSVFVLTLAAMLFALLGAGTATAHLAGGASATNARSVVTDRPAVAGVDVTVGLGGQFIRLRNQGSSPIVVLGYRAEPFLRVTRDQVQVNPRSTTARQSGLFRAGQVERRSAAAGGPWVHLSNENSVTWTDARVDARALPAGVSRSWTIPMVVDGQRVTVTGTRAGLSAPPAWPWLAALGLVAVGVAALSWVRAWHRPMAAVILVAAAAFIGHMIGAGASPHPSGALAGWVAIALLGGFCVLVAAIVVGSTLRRSELAASRLPILAVVLLLVQAGDISGLWNARLPFAGPDVLDRVLLVVTYGVALGLLVAAIRLARAPSRAAMPVAESPGG